MEAPHVYLEAVNIIDTVSAPLGSRASPRHRRHRHGSCSRHGRRMGFGGCCCVGLPQRWGSEHSHAECTAVRIAGSRRRVPSEHAGRSKHSGGMIVTTASVCVVMVSTRQGGCGDRSTPDHTQVLDDHGWGLDGRRVERCRGRRHNPRSPPGARG
jgi:hypothetical protein